MSEAEPNPKKDEKCPQCGAPLPSGVLAGLCPACLLKQGAAGDTATSPAAIPFQPPTVEEVARMFPQLEILDFIGKGGMGAVYKARQPALDRIVALKILPPQTTSGGQGFVERFNREARALARLNHPNIVAVYEFGQVNGLPFFVMEFVDGTNLRQLEVAGGLTPREALKIVPQICEALQFAHDEGIVHRDIKPENILVDKKGRVKIADFGIAKILGAAQEPTLTETRVAMGTPHYMAPEQLEKPMTVDHRADIFSLGVVFYEMLTGELPLGKFAPPSSRKVEVDVRLDDVVLRALERDPERRYQQISQVKTAVTNIGSTPGSPPPVIHAQADAMAREILAHDYAIGIRSCIRRAWALLRQNFWPLIGVTALILALLAVAGSIGGTVTPSEPDGTSLVMILLYGPLMGGLSLYYLKTIRGEPKTIEVAFSGFSHRFLHLFLAGFAMWALTALGFLLFILPGIYLMVAWWFSFMLVADKELDFWSAMELSRKVVTRHWWKLFGLGIVLFIVGFCGLLACGFGFFLTAPIAMLAATYAYEDIFGSAGKVAPQPAPAMGPSGTVVTPPPPVAPAGAGFGSGFGGGNGKRVAMIGVAAVAVVLAFIIIAGSIRHHHRREEFRRAEAENRSAEETPTPQPQEPPATVESFTFGPVVERELLPRAAGSNEFLDLDSQKLLTPPSEITSVLAASQPTDDENRLWEGLDIPEGSTRARYISWLRENGADLMFAGDGKIVGFDGAFAVAHGDTSTNWDDWSSLTPEQVRAAVSVVEWGREATEARLKGLTPPDAPKSGGVYNSAAQLDSRAGSGPMVNLLTRDQSVTWFFKTREGAMGVLQLVGFDGTPQVAKIRYKLLQKSGEQNSGASLAVNKNSRETLNDRMEAASMMMDMNAKSDAMAKIATDAANMGEAGIAKTALSKIMDMNVQSDTALEVTRALVKRGMRKQANEIARSIMNMNTRDQALSELAH